MTSPSAFDTDRFIHDTTQCLYSSLHIEEALHATILYLKKYLPLDVINAGITDDTLQSLRYIAVATAEKGFLVDERIRLSPEAINDARKFKIGDIKIDNCVSSSRAVEEAAAHMFSTGIPFTRGEKVDGFSTMTLVIRLAKPVTAYFNIVVFGMNRYNTLHRDRLALLKAPLTGAMLNLIHHRDILTRYENLQKVNEDLKSRLGHTAAMQLIGAETGLRHVMEKIRRVASTDSPVLLTGETGTGKERVAHAIHGMSERAANPMVCINCGAISESLVDSELFGHEKGAFTGAAERKRGYFEQADGGTVFLDEVAELPLTVQVKLLRVLQEKSFYRVGGQRPISVDVRVIAATHKDMAKMVGDGHFRSDLWFRLNVFPVHIPPLRFRREDIPDLARHFAVVKAAEMNLAFHPEFSDNSMERLTAYNWPGNIRELQNLIERSLILSGGNPLEFSELEKEAMGEKVEDSPTGKTSCPEPLDQMIADHIRKTLVYCDGKIEGPGGAAEYLGLHPSTLRGKMRKYHIGRIP